MKKRSIGNKHVGNNLEAGKICERKSKNELRREKLYKKITEGKMFQKGGKICAERLEE